MSLFVESEAVLQSRQKDSLLIPATKGYAVKVRPGMHLRETSMDDRMVKGA